MAPAKLVCYIGFTNGEYTPNICVDVRDAIQQSTFESEMKGNRERERATHAARDRMRLRRNDTERINRRIQTRTIGKWDGKGDMKQSPSLCVPIVLWDHVPCIPNNTTLHCTSLQHPTRWCSLTCRGNTDAPDKVPLLHGDEKL